MSLYLDKAKALRNSIDIHYNCAQATLIPFAQDGGLTDEEAKCVAANFGSGMRMGSLCGAITGALMALGLLGIDDAPTINSFYRRLKERHQNTLLCSELLKLNKQAGRPQKQHCDDMVFECVFLVEEILRNHKQA